MIKQKSMWFVAALVVAVSAFTVYAAELKPLVHPLFSDGAVLQRDVALPVWGWGTPGENISVEFAGQKKTTTVGADGKWMVKLDAMGASTEPRLLSITGAGQNRKTQIADVLVGDLWLCSGQSNMEMGIGACDVPEEIAAADYPLIRLLTVPKAVKYEPIETIACQWQHCSPATVAVGGWSGFSAAGYFFGRDLYQALKIPIGLIHSSWGGTICEAWASAEGLAGLDDFKERVAVVRAAAEQQRSGGQQGDIIEKWYVKHDQGTRDGWWSPELDDAAWKLMELPRSWEDGGLPGYDGIVWFRRDFVAPAAWAGKDLTLNLGVIDDIDTTYVNGVKVGSKEVCNQERTYRVQGALVKEGINVIAVRVLDTGGAGGINGQATQMRVGLAESEQPSISLAGAWKFKDTALISQLAGAPLSVAANNPNVSTVLFNGMIAPLLPYAIKGAIWYQGESNGNRGKQYRSLLPAMITDWRAHFGVGDFPFYIVSLASFMPRAAEPVEHDWANLREAQAMTARNLKNCGLAITIDIGDERDIHPKNKMEVGRRLALAALAQTYGQKIEYSGPWYRNMKIEGKQIRLHFDHAAGLVAKGGALKGFAIAGEDHKFVWAEAQVEPAAGEGQGNDTVVVSSANIAHPVAVRYAWDANPACNLYNAAGLPAVPFRTDTWPCPSDNNK